MYLVLWQITIIYRHKAKGKINKSGTYYIDSEIGVEFDIHVPTISYLEPKKQEGKSQSKIPMRKMFNDIRIPLLKPSTPNASYTWLVTVPSY